MTPVWSIVVAGGSGRRFGRLKQFSALRGRPVLEWAVDACRPHSDGVVLVLPASLGRRRPVRTAHGADTVVAGGATRADSVRCGLTAVPDGAAVIVVRDAARPLASPALFDAVLAAVTDGGADGAVPGVTPSDTIKVVDEFGRITDTLDRARLVAVQTPQAFSAVALRRAHAEPAPAGATDDAMLVESAGGTVVVVPGDPGNLKITEPDDLAAAERLLGGGAGMSMRIGQGIDVHRFSEDPHRPLVLGGVQVEGGPASAVTATPTPCATPWPTPCSARWDWAIWGGPPPTPIRCGRGPTAWPC